MLKILIAEDETFIRKSLINVIKSANDDLIVVGEAANGKQALELFEKNEVDLILTDIAMPVMDGMEFIRQVRERDPHVKIIVLSCLNDFENARKALKYHIHEYFLKVETDPSELIVKLKEIAEITRNEKSLAVEKTNSIGNTGNNIYETQEKFLKMLLWAPKTANLKLEQQILKLNLPLYEKNLFVSYMELDELRTINESAFTKDIELLEFSVLKSMRDILEKDNIGCVFVNGYGHYVVVICLKDEYGRAKVRERLFKIFSCFLDQFKKQFSMSLTVGISNYHDSFNELDDAYYQAISAFRHRFFNGKGTTIFYEDISNEIYKDSNQNKLEREYIITSLQSGDYLQLKKQLNIILQELKYQRYTEKSIRGTVMDIIVSIREKVTELLGNQNNLSLSNYDIFNAINTIDIFEDLKCWLFQTIEALFDYYINEKDNISYRKIIDRIKEYIESNYSKNINLNVVANYFQMNPCYISLIFKERTGENFIDFLSTLRIEKAKVLLEKGNLPIQNIGEMVGYPNPQYFSKVFKKTTGKSPTDYRTFIT